MSKYYNIGDTVGYRDNVKWKFFYDKRVSECNHIVAKRNSRRDIFKEMNRIYGTGIKK